MAGLDAGMASLFITAAAQANCRLWVRHGVGGKWVGKKFAPPLGPKVVKVVESVHGVDNSPMRIDLKVPFAEKDTAKALGARWDAAMKIWYVKDIADLTPFLRWIPDVKAASEGSAGGTTRRSTDTGIGPIE